MLHDYTPGLKAAGDKGEVAHGRGDPLLLDVGSNGVLSHTYFLEKGVMVEGKDYV